MSSLEEDKRLNSIQYLLQSAAVCRALGGKRKVIFHSRAAAASRAGEAALEKALDTMRRAVEAMDEAGFADMTLCPETMGKVGQLGTLDEVLALCGVDERITPCIDFGHLYARSQGAELNMRPPRQICRHPRPHGRGTGGSVPGGSMRIFPALPIPRAAKNATWTFAETQFGPQPAPADAAAENPWTGAHHYL